MCPSTKVSSLHHILLTDTNDTATKKGPTKTTITSRNMNNAVKKKVPLAIHVVATVHFLCLGLCSMSLVTGATTNNQEEVCRHLPDLFARHCVCSAINIDTPKANTNNDEVGLVCKGLNSTAFFDLSKSRKVSYPNSHSNNIGEQNYITGDFSARYEEALKRQVAHILVKDSDINVADMADFFQFTNLKNLSIVNSKVKRIKLEAVKSTLTLQYLNLSGNNLDSLNQKLLDSNFLSDLSSLDLSSNFFGANFPSLIPLSKLKRLDLSGNQFDENLDPNTFQSLPKTIQHLDISNNSWQCSPKLAWVHEWSRDLLASSVIGNPDDTRCKYENSIQDGPLFLLMEYYTKYVMATCPVRDNCKCFLSHVQEHHVTGERVYSVEVDCSDAGLTYFPKLPKHTRKVNLAGNKLDRNAFAILMVEDHNYGEVDNLSLDNNSLEDLPEKLLFMKLELRFSAKQNLLTSIPYDFSQRLTQDTTVIELSGNPWKCTCSSQITDLNLIDKVKDKDNLICGPTSEEELVSKKIYGLNPLLLCPPESQGEVQELILQMLCIVLAVLIVLIMSKLAYDFWVYRTKGQLPWIVLKMP